MADALSVLSSMVLRIDRITIALTIAGTILLLAAVLYLRRTR